MAIDHHTQRCASLQIGRCGNLALPTSINTGMIIKTAVLAALLFFSSSVSASKPVRKNPNAPLGVLLTNKSGLKYREFGTFVHPPLPGQGPAGADPRIVGVGQIPVGPIQIPVVVVQQQPDRHGYSGKSDGASSGGDRLSRIRKTFTDDGEPGDQWKTDHSTLINFKQYEDDPRIELDWNQVPQDNSFDKRTVVDSKDNFIHGQRNQPPRRIIPESYPPHRRLWLFHENDPRDERPARAHGDRYRVCSIDYERGPRYDDRYGRRNGRYGPRDENRYDGPRNDRYGPRDENRYDGPRDENRYEPRDENRYDGPRNDRYGPRGENRYDGPRNDRYGARDDYRARGPERRFDDKRALPTGNRGKLYKA